MTKLVLLRSFSAVALSVLILNGCGSSDSTAPVPQPGNPGTVPTAPAPLPSASPAASPTANPAAVAISIDPGSVGKGPLAFGENPKVVAKGTVVTWTNNDNLSHTVTADDGSFDSPTLGHGDTFSHTFDTAGDFPYFCKIHGKSAQSGMIRVNP